MGDIHSIYEKTYNFVYLRAKSILEKEEDVQQLMKEVYLKAAKSTSLHEDNMYEWLGKRTYVLGCQKYRKKKAREASIIELAEQEYRAGDTVDKEQTVEIIKDTFEQLPDMYQATLYALYYDHMRIKDIATIMGYSVGAIINRINYTHKYFKKALEIGQGQVRTKVRFSVEAVKEAFEQWSIENSLGTLAAQNLYLSICKELDEELVLVFEKENAAGKTKRVVECGVAELNVVCKELGAYSTKPFLDKQRIRILVLATGVLLFLVLLGALIFGGSSDEETKEPNKQPDTEAESGLDDNVTEDNVNVDAESETDTDTDTNANNQSGENDVTGGSVSEYMFPNSDTVKLTRADLQGMSAEELRIARNEIFARYGTIFGADDLKEYFSAKSWYNPRITFDEFYETIEMNAIEEANIALILQMEEEATE